MSTTASTRTVGVDIQESESNRALVEAIEATNVGCTVQHMPGLVRISVPGRLVITRESVEERLGREWETHEFQLAIVSYFGHIKEWDDDEIVIAWDH
jgi:phenol/toluene 2-monooxygenase (NADH) P2/A2